MSQDLYVRLFPVTDRSERLGFKVRGYSYRQQRFIGGVRPHWYKVDEALAAELEPMRQNNNDPRSQPLFQICTEAEKLRMEKDEQEQFLAALGAVSKTVSLPKEYMDPPTVNLAAPAQAQALPPIVAADVSGDMPSRSAAIPAARAGARKAARAEAAAENFTRPAPESEALATAGRVLAELGRNIEPPPGAITSQDIPGPASDDE